MGLIKAIFDASKKKKEEDTKSKQVSEPAPPEWTDEDEERLNKLIEERLDKAKQNYIKAFLEQPYEVREDILKEMRAMEVKITLEEMAVAAWLTNQTSEETQLERKKLEAGYLSSCRPEIGTTYKDLSDAYYDSVANRELLGDENEE